MSAFIQTRLRVGDYERWKPMFDADGPRAREKAKRWTIYRSEDDPGEVFVWIEFGSVADAVEDASACSAPASSTGSRTSRCRGSSRRPRPSRPADPGAPGDRLRTTCADLRTASALSRK